MGTRLSAETVKGNSLNGELKGVELLMSLVFLLKMPTTQPLSYLSKSPGGVFGSSKDHFLPCAQPVPKSGTPGWTTAAKDQHNPCPCHSDCASSSGMPRYQHPGDDSCQTLQLYSTLPNKQKLKNKM